ncbi:hypothetical protein BJF93_20645 [Xaviernesmea oryzae]|uniref:SIMPL domain-containing protein n=1 Tax=Xaviernesmea oryzae TaxID=464029 RepID=A0A1Q9B051_9HYPH|nr:SIMPL domain-containing protein [Xaviernesmea oryzae]OLP61351.1 hypothetical protein BJF93_20645 [Xaviernesmea oryzae]SEL50212.1 hypothetical protein SAMN04487976_1095 [Xaviernesmea oryzae]
MTLAPLFRPLPRAALLAAGLLAFASAGHAEPPPRPVISVTGTGQASAVPDLAVVSFSVVTQEKEARAALTANNAAMAKVLEAMKARGIAERDLQTSGFAINPQYVYPQNKEGETNPPQLTGYQVANTLTVRIRQIDKLGEILDQAVTLGVNQGGGIQFSIDKPEQLAEDARKAAVANAMAKARTLAAAAGVTLGRVVEMRENSGRPEPMPMMRTMAKDMAAESVPVAAGESAVTVDVEMSFDIAP